MLFRSRRAARVNERSLCAAFASPGAASNDRTAGRRSSGGWGRQGELRDSRTTSGGAESSTRPCRMPYVLSSQVCALLKRFSYSPQAFLDGLRLITSSGALHRRRRIAKRSLEGATARRRLSCSVPIEATRHSESPQSWISRPRGALPSLYHFPAKQRCAETSMFAMAGDGRPLSSDASES